MKYQNVHQEEKQENLDTEEVTILEPKPKPLCEWSSPATFCWILGGLTLSFLWFLYLSFPGSISSHRLGNLELNFGASKSAYDLIVISGGKQALHGLLGNNLPYAVGTPQPCIPVEGDECYEYDDYARLELTAAKSENGYCSRIEWSSPYARRLEDCFDIQEGVHWYGGGGPSYVDKWPIEIVARREAPIVPGDSLGGWEYGGVSENYWLVSSKAAFHVDEDVPLFFSVDTTNPNKICFVAEDKWPFKRRNGELKLKYDICTARDDTETFKDVHIRAFNKYYEKPSGLPDLAMLSSYFFSTWAEYKTDINQTKVLELADRMITEGFGGSSHIEIDDNWETCYGSAEFNLNKFPNVSQLTSQLRTRGFKTTLWIHQFINYGCPAFDHALQNDYFAREESNKASFIGWWAGRNAGIIDFTNDAAVQWWSARLRKLQEEDGIDSFKFDAGEVSWLPRSIRLNGSDDLQPSLATTRFVEAVARFGNMIETRVGRNNQRESIFVRMLDKDSRWGYDNGLQSMIPTLLDFGLKGYPFILPDMIGGNAYGDKPSKELYIRWTQLNAFMPAAQFSILPWNYDQETVDIVKEALKYREQYKDLLIKAAEDSVAFGYPINRPLWWLDPIDPKTFAVDNQYTLGDDLIAAPCIEEGKYSRNIYLPKGNWRIRVPGGAEDEYVTYQGPINLSNFRCPLNLLPFFVRVQ